MITASLPSILSSAEVAEAIGDRAPVTLLPWDLAEPLDEATAADVDAVVLPFHTLSATPNPHYIGAAQLRNLRSASSARFVQLLSLGSEGVTEALPAGAMLSNAAGVMEEQTAELACALILAMQRDLTTFWDSKRWDNHRTPGLAGARVTLLGVGGVGERIERRLAGFEVSLQRVGRHDRVRRDGAPVRGVEHLLDLARRTDVLAISVPLDPATRGLVDAAVLAALPDGALVVNVGRGPVVDTEALLAELRSGRLRAALDVVDPEPLPDDHELWRLPNAFVTPHVGGNTDRLPRGLVDLVAEQLVRLANDQPLHNVIKEAS